MKWILILLVVNGSGQGQWYQQEIPGWSSEALCKRAGADLEAQHPGPRFPFIAGATCEAQASPIVLPTPR